MRSRDDSARRRVFEGGASNGGDPDAGAFAVDPTLIGEAAVRSVALDERPELLARREAVHGHRNPTLRLATTYRAGAPSRLRSGNNNQSDE